MVETGIVIKSTGSWYGVQKTNGLVVQCKIRGKFRMKGIKTTNPLAVGDKVDFKPGKENEFGLVVKIYPRRNYIIRKSINLSKQAHILAANVDQAIVIVTLAFPKTYPEFIDRFLVSAEAYQIPAKIIFNKVDLYDDAMMQELNTLKSMYEAIGYSCYEVSAKEGKNIDVIDALLANKVSVLSGHSGIGKSTLINKIEPDLDLKTGEISEIHDSGKHTTTFAEMFELSNGGFIIDTPGIKGYGIVDIEKEEIAHYFPEMFKLLENCQFNNCTHSHEPDCAVKEAVKSGVISESRYKSYINLLVGEDDEKFRSVGY